MRITRPLTLLEVAKLIEARPIGNPDTLIEGLNEIHKVQKGDLTFVDFEKYYKRALSSPASVVLIDKEPEDSNQKALLVSDDPFRDYNRLVNFFKPFQPANNLISPSAQIGKETHIQPGTFIGNNVQIGDNCLIHANVSICDDTIIGDNVIIHPNTAIGSDAFYVKKRANADVMYEKMLSCGRVIIEDDVEIGAGCTIDRGVSGDTIIGRGTKIDNQVHIGHGTVIGKNCLFAAQVGIAGKVNIGDNVIIWGQAGISKDLTIGSDTVILARSGVGKSLKGGITYFGSPAREARRVWKEMAVSTQLPEMWEKLKKL